MKVNGHSPNLVVQKDHGPWASDHQLTGPSTFDLSRHDHVLLAEDEVKFNSSIVTKLQIGLDRNDRFLSEGNDRIYTTD